MNITELSIKEQNEFVVNIFKKTFASRGYLEEDEVKITSRVDKSVFLIGSTISVLKPYLLNESIPEKGVFLTQRAIRTQQLKRLFDTPNISEWSSYFKAMGVLSKYENIKDVIIDTQNFLIDGLNIPPSHLAIRISYKDEDLLEICKKYCNDIRIELDTMPAKYYSHKYGLSEQGIYGRNFNIAILDKRTELFKDIGNIIAIEDSNKKYGTEFAVGTSAILSRLNGHKHTIMSATIANTIKIHSEIECKFADCLSVVANLMYEGIKPNSSNMYSRILKKYLIGLFYFANILHFVNRDVISMSNKYIEDEYRVITDIGEQIVKYNGRWQIAV